MKTAHSTRLTSAINTIMARCAAAALLGLALPSRGAVPASAVPTFRLRARVLNPSGGAESLPKYTFSFTAKAAVESQGAEWSAWLVFDRAQAEEVVGPHSYPNCYLRDFPVVTKLRIGRFSDPLRMEAELKFDGDDRVFPLAGDLFGPELGILLWRDANQRPQAATMADYNRRYWRVLAPATVPPSQRPKRMPIIDRFIPGDCDRTALHEGISTLAGAGFSGIMLPPDARARDILLQTGLRRTAWATYNPPGYAFAHATNITPASLTNWAFQEAAPYLKAGYAPDDMAIYAMSDEPGWYYPAAFTPLTNNPAALARFRDYLKAQGLSPRDVGAKRWNDVLPLGRSRAVDLPSKRLFYWTMRFFPWDSAHHFADSTRALEAAFYTNLPVLVNWNFFSGRFYVPGPVANNAAKQDRDAAMGGHDWLEFGRLRGCTMLWTEDWFGDGQAYQWSYYCARLRCAAALSGVEFGGYVIPRTAGQRADGIVQKIMTVAGSGGKALKYFVFGPEYNFPGNCYSENIQVLPKMAEAHRMLGSAEELLWPGRRPRPQVAILMPRSAQVWDARDIAIPHELEDATNTDLNRATVDYLAEVFDLYLALQHANIPTDIVAEDLLTPDGLKGYRVLYVTEPDIPQEGQKNLIRWVQAGGILVTVAGAGAYDRYHESCEILHKGLGIAETSRERLLVSHVRKLPAVGAGKGSQGSFTAVGVRSHVKPGDALVEAVFDEGDPAVLHRNVKAGRSVHFAWMPGLAYAVTADRTQDGLPVGWSEAIRRWIHYPVGLAGIIPPATVDHALVETPLLVSEKGAVVTLLNWTGAAIERLKVVVRPGFPVAQITSVKHGALTFQSTPDGYVFELPVGAADFVLLRR